MLQSYARCFKKKGAFKKICNLYYLHLKDNAGKYNAEVVAFLSNEVT